MYCQRCGTEAKDSDTFCGKCGLDLQVTHNTNSDSHSTALSQSQAGFQDLPNQYQNQNQNQKKNPGEGVATASGILGVIGLVLCFNILFGILAIVLGRTAISVGYVGKEAKHGVILGIIIVSVNALLLLCYFVSHTFF
ncbi:MAG: zinc ribbon domain-containing protein [Peptococcaceae bacterium]|nr:zinc ribbon domain-containing protein [Peptococcaceae bacterium]